jgi:histidine ammonia-lyase
MLELTGECLSLEDVVAVARRGLEIAPLSQVVKQSMLASQRWVEQAISKHGETVYGVNTGVGPLAREHIPPDQSKLLSRKIILSCQVGVGDPLPEDVVRAMILIRANTLAKGRSAVRPLVAQTLIDMLNAGVTPHVPSKGSLGASGDLAPLAHLAVVMTRDPEGAGDDHSGRAWFEGELLSGAEAMARAGIQRIVPEAKDGLALTNGTNFMAAAAALLLVDGESLVRHAEIAAALSMEALTAISEAYHPALHKANAQPGQIVTAANLRMLLEGSRLVDSDLSRVQDAYSLRCTPQVIGPVRDVLAFLRERVTGAINSATDNPLVFVDLPASRPRKVISGGNFHGSGLAMWLDLLSIALAQIGSIAERRTFRLVTRELSNGLPSMLIPKSGLDSGLMMPQYTSAALVSDNKTLAHPDSVDSIPSGANQEDHVSMGANAARHTMEVAENLRLILAIEMLTAAQGIYLRPEGPSRLAPGTAAAYGEIRRRVEPLEFDRPLHGDVQALADLISTGDIPRSVGRMLGQDLA